MFRKLSFVGVVSLALASSLISGCADNGEFGFNNHPLDCAQGYVHNDCLPGTAGYDRGVGSGMTDQQMSAYRSQQILQQVQQQVQQQVEVQAQQRQLSMPQTTNCRQVGNSFHCTTFGNQQSTMQTTNCRQVGNSFQCTTVGN